MSSSGNNASGSKAVTATGIASVAHQTAINTAIAATVQPAEDNSAGGGNNIIKKNNVSPIKKPFFLYAGITYTNIFS